MSETVYFLPVRDSDDNDLAGRMAEAIRQVRLFDGVGEKDIVAVKTHFGESNKSGYPRPVFLRNLGDLIKERGGLPFLTETSTLYRGNRTNAVTHLLHAGNQGFTVEATGMPVVMADGLFGDNEVPVEIKGKIYSSINVAAEIPKAQWLVVMTHFTGHMVSGFGGALKNLGMGCTSRRAKMIQHSTAKPTINRKACTLCGECERWCPVEAITLDEESAVIDHKVCIGCGQCLAVCRFDAVKYNWKATYDDLQKKITEHALGVVESVRGNTLYITLLTRISKDCDCIPDYEKITDDIGLMISRDPVAIDTAALDMVEEKSGKLFSQMTFNIPYRVQVEYAREIGFGSSDYELMELDV